MVQPQAVIFDIGNVLIEWQPERYYDSRLGEAGRRELFAAVDLHGMNDRIDAGARFRDTVYDTAEDHPRWATEIRWWFDHWIDLASPRIDRSIRLMRALRQRGVPVFALTNFGDDSFAYACTQYRFLSEFDRAYVSGRMAVIKPDPRIYEMVEQDCGLPPDALLFTDDRADNIAAASARGWQVHHFKGADGWAAALVAAGLLTESEAA
ncbi:HAD family hydrolase [Szabonella alba]|uniref:HAD family phosphatase n=1 Tax=Szabonella alba TaxID=2804194 RepID=A0A8K0VFD9_9RHOB|nr:HAD family phosphatase [Szabonella alba]MBL4918025.1 HAD family phosphatase [Szabonella alba]